MKKNKILKVLRRAVKVLVISALAIGFVVGAGFAVTNAVVILRADSRIITVSEAAELENVDCILVLGCRVKPDGTPSSMLYDRVAQGVELWKNGVSELLFMSGDSRDRYYDETGTMKELAEEMGVASESLSSDRYGLSTYDSIVRAAKVFGYEKIVIVTQEYHLYRALYIADMLGIEAYGVASDLREYSGQVYRDIREIAARSKDFLFCIVRPEPEMGNEN